MADKPAQTKSGDTATTVAAPAAASGGLKAWLPLILTITIMPVLAWVMTQFVILPKLTVVLGREAGASGEEHPAENPDAAASHGKPAEGAGHGKGEHGSSGAPSSTSHASKFKEKFQLSKLVVNVSGSLGTRLLLCSVTLTGNDANFRTVIEENADMLKDLASSVLASKTISDLEKPEARNLLRTELISQFNGSLGKNLIQDIYITEMAIQ